jgi:Flp pilus assembly protein TadG
MDATAMTRLASSVRAQLRQFLRDTSATTAAEFALVLPVFILLIFGTIGTGIALSAIIQMHFAAEKAARCLAVDISGNCPNVDTFAKTYYNGPSMTGLLFQEQTTLPAPACGRLVVATGTYQFFTGLKSSSLALKAQACYPSQN